MPRELRIYSDIVIFGIRVTFESNDELALKSTLQLYETWNETESGAVTQSIYIVLDAYTVNVNTCSPSSHIVGDQLKIAGGAVVAEADGRIGRGRCAWARNKVDQEALAESINTIMLFLIAHAGRIPVHAAAVMAGDTAIVLAGPSGSGKSSLALAASRAGLSILSEDTIYVQTDPGLRLWSMTQAIHVAYKPVDEDAKAMRFRSGRWKHAIEISSPSRWSDKAVLCVLAPGERLALEPIDAADAVATLTAHPEPGYEFYGDRSADAVRALARRGCWRLSLSRDADEAIDTLLKCASKAA